MKKVIKIINIVTIILSAVDLVCLFILGGVFTRVALFTQESDPALVIVLVFGVMFLYFGALMIPMIIVSAIGLKKLKTATCKRDLRAIGILSIIFGNPVSGIFMLCIPESNFSPNQTN